MSWFYKAFFVSVFISAVAGSGTPAQTNAWKKLPAAGSGAAALKSVSATDGMDLKTSRSHFAAAVRTIGPNEHRIFVMGGLNNANNGILADMEVYDIVQETTGGTAVDGGVPNGDWTVVDVSDEYPDPEWETGERDATGTIGVDVGGRWGAAAIEVGGMVFLMGGSPSIPEATTWIGSETASATGKVTTSSGCVGLDTVSKTWSTCSFGSMTEKLAQLGLTKNEEYLFIVGGRSNFNPPISAGAFTRWSWYVNTEFSSPPSRLANLNVARAGHACVVSASTLVCGGGYNEGGAVSSAEFVTMASLGTSTTTAWTLVTPSSMDDPGSMLGSSELFRAFSGAVSLSGHVWFFGGFDDLAGSPTNDVDAGSAVESLDVRYALGELPSNRHMFAMQVLRLGSQALFLGGRFGATNLGSKTVYLLTPIGVPGEEGDKFFVKSITPRSAITAGGETVIISVQVADSIKNSIPGFDSSLSTPPDAAKIGASSCTSLSWTSATTDDPYRLRCVLETGIGTNLDTMVVFDSSSLGDSVAYATGGADFSRAPPLVSYASPSIGPQNGGVEVIVVGSNFGTDADVKKSSGETITTSRVYIGDTRCTSATGRINDTAAICRESPAGRGSSVSISVATDLQIGTRENAFMYPDAEATDVFGSPFSTAGGKEALINGENFASRDIAPLEVWIYSSESSTVPVVVLRDTDVRYISSTSVAFSMPPGVGTNYTVVLNTGGVFTTAGTFDYSPPSISVVDVIANGIAGSLNSEGGSVIRISGANFGNPSSYAARISNSIATRTGSTFRASQVYIGDPSLEASITIGGHPCASLSDWIAAGITCTAPAGGGSKNNVLITIGGQTTSGSAATSLTYEQPTLTSVTPSHGVRSAVLGTQVYNFTITGRAFGTTAAHLESITIGSYETECPEPLWESPSIVHCVIDGYYLEDGASTVSVTIGGLQSRTASNLFDVVGTPFVIDVSPESVVGGESITIIGKDLPLYEEDVLRVFIEPPPRFRLDWKGNDCTHISIITPAVVMRCRVPVVDPSVLSTTVNELLLTVTTIGNVSRTIEAPVQLQFISTDAPPDAPLRVFGWRSPGVSSSISLVWEEDVTGRSSDYVEPENFLIEYSPYEHFAVETTESQVVARDTCVVESYNYVDVNGNVTQNVKRITRELQGFESTPYFFRISYRNLYGTGPPSAISFPVFETCFTGEYLKSQALDLTEVVCTPCPDGAFCGGGWFQHLIPRQGFWRAPWTSGGASYFAQCLLPDACNGYQDSGSSGSTSGDASNVSASTLVDLRSRTKYAKSSLSQAVIRASRNGNVRDTRSGNGEYYAGADIGARFQTDGSSTSTAMPVAGRTFTLLELARRSGAPVDEIPVVKMTALLADAGVNYTEVVGSGIEKESTTRATESADESDLCIDGHESLLCAACAENYAPSEDNVCSECSPKWLIALIVLGGAALIILVVSLLVYQTIISKGSPSAVFVSLGKIGVTHLQQISLAASFQLQWPGPAQTLFSSFSTVSSVSANVFSPACMVDSERARSFFYSRTYSGSLGILLTPILAIVLVAIFWRVTGVCWSWCGHNGDRLDDDGSDNSSSNKPSTNKNPSKETSTAPRVASRPVLSAKATAMSRNRTLLRLVNVQEQPSKSCHYRCLPAVVRSRRDGSYLPVFDRYLVSMVVIAFLVHTTVTSTAVKLFTCASVGPDGETRTYLVQDPSVDCTSPRHLSWMLALGLPALLLWTAGIPLLGFLVLYSRRHKLHTSPSTRKKFGFLFSSFVPRFYYWEILILLRKTLIVFVSTFLSPLGPDIAAFAGVILYILALVLHSTAQPYTSVELNRAEQYSLLVSLFTLLFGLFMYSPNVNSTGDGVLTVALLIINFVFVIYLVIMLAATMSKYCQARIAHVCGRDVTHEISVPQDATDFAEKTPAPQNLEDEEEEEDDVHSVNEDNVLAGQNPMYDPEK